MFIHQHRFANLWWIGNWRKSHSSFLENTLPAQRWLVGWFSCRWNTLINDKFKNGTTKQRIHINFCWLKQLLNEEFIKNNNNKTTAATKQRLIRKGILPAVFSSARADTCTPRSCCTQLTPRFGGNGFFHSEYCWQCARRVTINWYQAPTGLCVLTGLPVYIFPH